MSTILFDLDGVLADSQSRMLDAVFRRTGTRVHYRDWVRFSYLHDLAGQLTQLDKQEVAKWLNSTEVVNAAPTILGAQAFVRLATYRGYTPAVATGRPAFQRNDTLTWLAPRFPEIEPRNVYLLPAGIDTKEFKSRIALLLNALVVVEDSAETLLFLHRKPEFEKVLLVLVDRPWNSNVKFPSGQYRLRIGNWKWYEQGWPRLLGALDRL